VHHLKIIFLEQQSPSGELVGMLNQRHEPPYRLMVTHQSKALTIKIWTKMGNSPHHRQCFSLVGQIIGLAVLLLREVLATTYFQPKSSF
jgi:hypothetical protein